MERRVPRVGEQAEMVHFHRVFYGLREVSVRGLPTDRDSVFTGNLRAGKMCGRESRCLGLYRLDQRFLGARESTRSA